MRQRPRWSWLGACALVLTIAVAGGWSVALVLAISARSPPITDNTQSTLTAIGSVLAGAIATFIGSQIHKRGGDEEDDKDDE